MRVGFSLRGNVRSTSSVGRSIVRAALAEHDPAGAERVTETDNWRKKYVEHFRRLTEVGRESPAAADSIAARGLKELHRQLVWMEDAEDGAVARELPLAEWVPAVTPQEAFDTEVTIGTGQSSRELVVPLEGRLLSGESLLAQLDAWVTRGVLEPSAAAAVRSVAEHPEWLALPGRTVVCLGAGAELSPLPPLLEWGATVAAVDLPDPQRWARLTGLAEQSGGRLILPSRVAPAAQPGADLLTDLPGLIDWLASLGSGLVVGNYTYADGGTNVALSAACDLLGVRLRDRVDDVTLAFLATPTDVFVVPAEAVEASLEAHAARSGLSRLGRGVMGGMSGQRLLQPNYATDAVGPQIHDALVSQQGPNYALAKRVQRWRATADRAAGLRVSLNVAPPTRTHSVMKNRGLAAAYSGAGRFGVGVFDPATTRVLMAALLVHDLTVDPPTWDHPWQAEAHQAVHGGLWRTAYSPRSALGLAAVAGLPRSLFHQGM
jgi:hypothetical protein